nr:hypothetical protein Iba_scaffold9913CG0020 [Ipomoea batatas]
MVHRPSIRAAARSRRTEREERERGHRRGASSGHVSAQHRCCVTEKIRSLKPPAGSTTAALNGPHQRRLRVRHPTPPWLSKLCPRPSCSLNQVSFFAARAWSCYHRSPTPTAIAANHGRSSFAV